MRILTLLLLLTTATVSAQVKYGKITYLRTSEMTITINNDEPSPHDKQIKEMMAKMQASGAFNKTFHASFSPEAFNCVEEYKDPAESSTESGGSVIVIMTGDEDPRHYYTNVAKKEIMNYDLIFDKGFLVSGAAEAIDWTLTGEKVPPSEMTAGLDLLIATGVTSQGDTLTAGYAPSLPAQVGPMNYYGLPGAIITLEIPDGKSKTVYRATNIEVSSGPIEIEQPSNGKPISLEKFREQKAKREKTMTRQFMRG
ncbi:MAG: GLPGLI family protein [Bacteroidota bacterium]